MKKVIISVSFLVAIYLIVDNYSSIEKWITDKTLTLLSKEEGVRYKAYKDSKGIWTIGVGHVILPNEKWMLTATLTDQQVKDILKKDLEIAKGAVLSSVIVPLTKNKFDALLSLAFNIGANGFKTSTLVKSLNAGKSKEILTENWLRWSKDKELLPRRKREVEIFFS